MECSSGVDSHGHVQNLVPNLVPDFRVPNILLFGSNPGLPFRGNLLRRINTKCLFGTFSAQPPLLFGSFSAQPPLLFGYTHFSDVVTKFGTKMVTKYWSFRPLFGRHFGTFSAVRIPLFVKSSAVHIPLFVNSFRSE